jgi:hypothetical protein
LRQQLASVDYYWSVWVLSFDEQRKQQVLARLLGDVSSSKIALLMIFSFMIIALMIAYYAGLFNVDRQQDPLNKRYQIICQRLAKKGIARQQGQAPSDYAAAVNAHLSALSPQIASDFTALSNAFVALKYQPLTVQQAQQRQQQFKQLYRRLRLRLLRR